MIRLTQRDTGRQTMINPAWVQAVEHGQHNGTCIWLNAGVLAVEETPEYVLEALGLTAKNVETVAQFVSVEMAIGNADRLQSELRARGWVLERADADQARISARSEAICAELDVAQRILIEMCLALADRKINWSNERDEALAAIERARAMVAG